MIARARTFSTSILWTLLVFNVFLVLLYRRGLQEFMWELDHNAIVLFGLLTAFGLLLAVAALRSVVEARRTRLEIDGGTVRLGTGPGRWARTWTVDPAAAAAARVVEIDADSEQLPVKKLSGFHGFFVKRGRWRLAGGDEAFVLLSGDRAVHVPFVGDQLLFSAEDPEGVVAALGKSAAAADES